MRFLNPLAVSVLIGQTKSTSWIFNLFGCCEQDNSVTEVKSAMEDVYQGPPYMSDQEKLGLDDLLDFKKLRSLSSNQRPYKINSDTPNSASPITTAESGEKSLPEFVGPISFCDPENDDDAVSDITDPDIA